MNKREAKRRAYEEDITVADLRRMIDATRGRGGRSRVNPEFGLEMVLDMMARALDGKDDDMVLRNEGIGRSGTGHVMIVTNILRECA